MLSHRRDPASAPLTRRACPGEGGRHPVLPDGMGHGKSPRSLVPVLPCSEFSHGETVRNGGSLQGDWPKLITHKIQCQQRAKRCPNVLALNRVSR